MADEKYSAPLTPKEKDDKDAYQRGVKDQKKTSLLILVLSLILALGVGGVGGALIYQAASKKEDDPLTALTKEIYQYLKDDWLYASDYQTFKDTFNGYMIKGMLDNDDDPYTFYTSTYSGQGLDTTSSGAYGIASVPYTAEAGGIVYGGLKIIKLYEGTFKAAGFQKDDVIIGVKHPSDSDFSYFTDMPLSLANQAMSPSDTAKKEKVTFRFIRNKTLMPDLEAGLGEAEDIAAQVVSDGLDANNKHVLGIKINTFLGTGDNAPTTVVKKLITESIAASGPLDRLVFDCRDNGGGWVGEGAGVANLFLPKGSIDYMEGDNKGNITKTYTQTSDPSFTTAQVKDIRIILNGSSASATELFAKALQENGMAKIYGSTSYGKGIEQAIINLKNGGTLRLTVKAVYGPKKTTFDGVGKGGIVPDVTTNDYLPYKQHLVYNSYQEDAYRLSYSEEQRIFEGLKMFSQYANKENYLEALNSFKKDEALSENGLYDSRTMYHYVKLNLEQYLLKESAEMTKVLMQETI
ncbi:MAG: S41 family peptidase [Bacilli bacterium]|jgi:carboxyl-terminal processing protease|nr:S41 family peptidase [Bacilli bacterium]